MQPVTSPSSDVPARRRPRSEPRATPDVMRVDGLDGPTELRRASGGHWQVWPRPDAETLRSLYAERFYEEDKSTYLDDVERDRSYWDAIWGMRRRVMEDALPGEGRRLLDVGSSGGALLDHFQQHGWQPFGIEPSPRAARYAREHFGLEVFCGELLDFGHDEQSEARAGFDAIHCAQVLEHVLEPEACAERIAALLSPGGVAYVEVPNDFSALQTTARDRLGLRSWWVAPQHHLNYFDADSLAALLGRHGLVEIDRLASFPMEMFLLMGEDYVSDAARGPACHARRMAFERHLIDADRLDTLASFYRALARAGAGRTCGLLVRKPDIERVDAARADEPDRGGR